MQVLLQIVREGILLLAVVAAWDLLLRDTPLAKETIAGGLGCVAAVYLALSLYARRGHHPRLDPALRPRNWARSLGRFALGMGIAGVVCGLIVFLRFHLARPVVPEPTMPEAFSFFVGDILAMSILEEFFFRLILLRVLLAHTGWRAALAVSSVLFGLYHLVDPRVPLDHALMIASTAGLLLGCAYLLSGSIWLPAGLHFGWNLVIGAASWSYARAMALGTPLGERVRPFYEPDGIRLGPLEDWPLLVVGTAAGLVALYLVIRARRREPLRLEPPLPQTGRPAVLPPNGTRAAL